MKGELLYGAPPNAWAECSNSSTCRRRICETAKHLLWWSYYCVVKIAPWTQFQIAELFGTAYIRSATMPTALNAFKINGIWPYNPQIFIDVDLVLAEATEIDLELTPLTSQITAPPLFQSRQNLLILLLTHPSIRQPIRIFNRGLPNSLGVNIASTPFNLLVSRPFRSNINISSG